MPYVFQYNEHPINVRCLFRAAKMGPGKAEYLNQFSLLSGYLRAFPAYQRKWAIKDLTTLILPYTLRRV